MWNINISGKKKAVLLAWANALGYGEPEIEYESGSEDKYFLSCTISTRHDSNPYGDRDEAWDGSKADLSQFDETEIRKGKYNLLLNVCGLKQLTGYLSVEIEMKNIPDSGSNTDRISYHYINGEIVPEKSSLEKPKPQSRYDEKELQKTWKWEKTTDGSGYIITDYNGKETDIAVPERISDLPVVELADGLFSPNRFLKNPNRRTWFEKSIKTVSIPKTVLKIGKETFSRNLGLKSVYIPEGVKIIGDSAFSSCKNIKEIIIPESDAEIGESAFYACE